MKLFVFEAGKCSRLLSVYSSFEKLTFPNVRIDVEGLLFMRGLSSAFGRHFEKKARHRVLLRFLLCAKSKNDTVIVCHAQYQRLMKFESDSCKIPCFNSKAFGFFPLKVFILEEFHISQLSEKGTSGFCSSDSRRMPAPYELQVKFCLGVILLDKGP